MKAAVIHAFGPAEVLKVEEVPVPEPAPDEVLVRVHASSVNPVDNKTRAGGVPWVGREDLPAVLGRDIAGTVAQCGGAASRFRPGDPVYAMLESRHGGNAEYAVVRERDLARKPERLDYPDAAAVPLAALTAWQGLFQHGRLQPGQHVLIHGGAGGVGHFAIQFARVGGAKISTTVSREDFDFVRSLGAQQAIDYRSRRFEDEVKDVDLVLDLVGGDTQDRSWSVLKRGGALISTLTLPSREKAQELGARAENYMTRPDASHLEEIGRLIDGGEVTPHVQAVFPLDDIGAAQIQLEQSHTRGKIVRAVGG